MEFWEESDSLLSKPKVSTDANSPVSKIRISEDFLYYYGKGAKTTDAAFSEDYESPQHSAASPITHTAELNSAQRARLAEEVKDREVTSMQAKLWDFNEKRNEWISNPPQLQPLQYSHCFAEQTKLLSCWNSNNQSFLQCFQEIDNYEICTHNLASRKLHK